MKCGPEITSYLPKDEWHKGGPPPVLFDAGEITMSPAAVDDMRFIDLHPGDILARHLSGRWKYDREDVKRMNFANLRRGQGAIESTSLWWWRASKASKKLHFTFYVRTEDGRTHITSSLDSVE